MRLQIPHDYIPEALLTYETASVRDRVIEMPTNGHSWLYDAFKELVTKL